MFVLSNTVNNALAGIEERLHTLFIPVCSAYTNYTQNTATTVRRCTLTCKLNIAQRNSSNNTEPCCVSFRLHRAMWLHATETASPFERRHKQAVCTIFAHFSVWIQANCQPWVSRNQTFDELVVFLTFWLEIDQNSVINVMKQILNVIRFVFGPVQSFIIIFRGILQYRAKLFIFSYFGPKRNSMSLTDKMSKPKSKIYHNVLATLFLYKFWFSRIFYVCAQCAIAITFGCSWNVLNEKQ